MVSMLHRDMMRADAAYTAALVAAYGAARAHDMRAVVSHGDTRLNVLADVWQRCSLQWLRAQGRADPVQITKGA